MGWQTNSAPVPELACRARRPAGRSSRPAAPRVPPSSIRPLQLSSMSAMQLSGWTPPRRLPGRSRCLAVRRFSGLPVNRAGSVLSQSPPSTLCPSAVAVAVGRGDQDRACVVERRHGDAGRTRDQVRLAVAGDVAGRDRAAQVVVRGTAGVAEPADHRSVRAVEEHHRPGVTRRSGRRSSGAPATISGIPSPVRSPALATEAPR